MKRLIVVSDSHGFIRYLQNAVHDAIAHGTIDYFVFLGDGVTDMENVTPVLKAHNPNIQIILIAGNNDWHATGGQMLSVFSVNGVCIHACHGHIWQVKYGLERLLYASKERDALISLYGHTHQGHLEWVQGVLMINPGAICAHGMHHVPYAEICISDDGQIKSGLKTAGVKPA